MTEIGKETNQTSNPNNADLILMQTMNWLLHVLNKYLRELHYPYLWMRMQPKNGLSLVSFHQNNIASNFMQMINSFTLKK